MTNKQIQLLLKLRIALQIAYRSHESIIGLVFHSDSQIDMKDIITFWHGNVVSLLPFYYSSIIEARRREAEEETGTDEEEVKQDQLEC